MRYTKKAKNAELLGLRFSISFLQVKNELDVKLQTNPINSKVEYY